MRIVRVREHVAFRVQYEARRPHLGANGRGLNSMQRPGVACTRTGGGDVVDYDVEPTRFEPLVDGLIEAGFGCASGPDKVAMEIVVQQVQPHDIQSLQAFRQRHDIR